MPPKFTLHYALMPNDAWMVSLWQLTAQLHLIGFAGTKPCWLDLVYLLLDLPSGKMIPHA